jgi:hypothetical protein
MSGLRGVPGALADSASQSHARGLERHVNERLRKMAGSGGAAGGGDPMSAHGAGGGPSANMRLGRRMMLAAGWPSSQWPALQALWNQESGWNSRSVNASSGAYGIPQALGHGHPFALGDARGQIAWGLRYIRSRYGSPAAAEQHEKAFNWYARGSSKPVAWGGWNARGGEYETRGPTLRRRGRGCRRCGGGSRGRI